jgi:TRAP-type mannitol/chloroaromatic compound transport system permease small subunit
VTFLLTQPSPISINLIDKSRLQGEAFSYAGSGLVWKARLFLFLGFALIAGGFAGSCVKCLKDF